MKRSRWVIVAVLAAAAAAAAFVVLTREDSTSTADANCSQLPQGTPRIDCFGARIVSRIDAEGLDETARYFDQLAERDTAFQRDCHLAWHVAGEHDGKRLAASADGDKPRLKLPEETSFCQQGYLHGYTIAYLDARAGSGERVPDDVCERVGSERRERLNCAHSLGHAYARAMSLRKTAVSCKRLVMTGTWEAGILLRERSVFECQYGAAMEKGLREPDDFSREDCADAGGLATVACAAFLPGTLAQRDASDEQIASDCESFPDPFAQQACAATFGTFTEEGCDLLAGRPRESCERARSEPTERVEVVVAALLAQQSRNSS